MFSFNTIFFCVFIMYYYASKTDVNLNLALLKLVTLSMSMRQFGMSKAMFTCASIIYTNISA